MSEFLSSPFFNSDFNGSYNINNQNENQNIQNPIENGDDNLIVFGVGDDSQGNTMDLYANNNSSDDFYNEDIIGEIKIENNLTHNEN